LSELLIGGLTALLAVATLIPLLPVAHGFVRVCDFPRLQIAAFALVLAAFTLWDVPPPSAWVLLAVQAAVAMAQVLQCIRFTPLWRIQSLAFDGAPDDPSVVRIIAANVKMSNRAYDRLIRMVEENDPDIVILMEVDEAWIEGVARLRERLPVVVEQAQDNAYGMALYSRLELEDPEVRFTLIENVPSIRTAVVLPDGQKFRLYAVHPEPPVPHMDTLGRDGEIILVGKEVVEDPLPVIVSGDLNDVAWSHTTRRFQRLAGLLDPRVGRGFFNSFDARFWFLRWPLDHLFHDPHFRLVSMTRLPHIGSDHFPMMFEVALTKAPAAEAAPEKPDETDVDEARDVVQEASELDREPIGTDWEKVD
jgi:endonuclease/exonuclease/phosphatase (EEP) superfamily protein YafD